MFILYWSYFKNKLELEFYDSSITDQDALSNKIVIMINHYQTRLSNPSDILP